MPKMKTKSGAKKRFSFTAKGLVRVQSANNRHRRISKGTKAKLHSRGTRILESPSAIHIIKSWMPNG